MLQTADANSHCPPDSGSDLADSCPLDVYRVLADHQSTDTRWELSSLLSWLHQWSCRFIETFGLNLKEVSLCVEELDPRCFGHFRSGRNGFGLKGEIAINRTYIGVCEPHDVLGTLLHELLHAWEAENGRPGKNNYHTRAFRRKAGELGLIVDDRGRQSYASPSRFFSLLKGYGIHIPEMPALTTPPETVRKGKSKLRKWSCRCDPPVNVRVAIRDFRAKCLCCRHPFTLQDS